MIRGTTPTVQWTLPFDHSLLECMYLTISQRGTVLVEKSLTDCTCDGANVSCRLSQEDTLALDCKKPAEIQVRVKTINGDAMASQIVSIPAGRILKDGEI